MERIEMFGSKAYNRRWSKLDLPERTSGARASFGFTSYHIPPFASLLRCPFPACLTVQLIAINDINLVGSPFDAAMDAMIALQGPDVEFTFFRGTKDELRDVSGESGPRTTCATAFRCWQL